MLKYELFCYNIVVAAYPVFVYVVSRAGRQVHLLPDDDKRYAIETSRSSESVLKSDLK